MTERKVRAPATDELLRLVIESAHDYAIFSMDSEGLVTSWNSGAERLTGWSAEEIVGRTADVIFTPEDRADGGPEQEREQAFATGRAEDERWQQRKDGTRFWASGLMMQLEDRSQGVTKILRDRTEHHLANERVRLSEERFRLLATNIPQLVFRGLSDGSRTWPSPQWIDFTGLGVEASLGLGWLDAIHPDAAPQRLARGVRARVRPSARRPQPSPGPDYGSRLPQRRSARSADRRAPGARPQASRHQPHPPRRSGPSAVGCRRAGARAGA